MDAFLLGGGLLSIVVFVFLVTLALMWWLLPLAVFGIKNRLSILEKFAGQLEKIEEASRILAREHRRTNDILSGLALKVQPIESEAQEVPISTPPRPPSSAPPEPSQEDNPPLSRATACEDPVEAWEREQRAKRERISPSGKFVEFDCPHCGDTLEVDAAAAGRTVNCPDCGELIAIPGEGTEGVKEGEQHGHG